MSQYAFYVNSDDCITCKACGMACKDKNDLMPGRKFRRIHSLSTGSWAKGTDGTYLPKKVFSYSLSISCNHCAAPACVAVCPTGAMQKDPDNGIVDVDKDVCIGCGSCAAACPYDAPSVDKVTQTSGKCNFCKDLLAKDEMPACVAACSMQAIEYGTLDELKAAHPDAVAQVAPLPDAGQTSPSLLIKPHTKYAADMRFESFNMPEELQASE